MHILSACNSEPEIQQVRTFVIRVGTEPNVKTFHNCISAFLIAGNKAFRATPFIRLAHSAKKERLCDDRGEISRGPFVITVFRAPLDGRNWQESQTQKGKEAQIIRERINVSRVVPVPPTILHVYRVEIVTCNTNRESLVARLSKRECSPRTCRTTN